ncbi:hypothetical protein E2562_026453 [Oryza meyeriana var. granulata]|uniref:Uncharacterized protein n=1 Tax=Oryza meyeriana var. granulata TaxID=110450 RepID=A0A6G1DQT9_9ORYZ|nr:hypothetical protein E2562_026453 [Oryza meyeriana var. granulata]
MSAASPSTTPQPAGAGGPDRHGQQRWVALVEPLRFFRFRDATIILGVIELTRSRCLGNGKRRGHGRGLIWRSA